MYANYVVNDMRPKSSKVDEEMQSLQLDRPTAGKSATQIQRHTIDEQYQNKPIERSLYILTKGDDLQKLSVIQSIPNLLNTDNYGTISRIIPKIQQELPNSSSEFHIATSQMFRLLFEMRISINLIRPVLQGIENKDPVVAQAWIETLAYVILSISEQFLKTEVVPYVIKMTQLNKSLFYRVASCKLIGQIAIHPKMNPFEVKKDILPLIQSLCQDCWHEVRTAACIEIPNVAKGLNNDSLIRSSLLPCLVELCTDENVNVRSAAISSVVYLTDTISGETIKITIIPLLQKLCLQSISDNTNTQCSLAKVYGMLLTNVGPHLNETESVWFLQFVKHLSQKGLHEKEELDMDPTLSVECRELCAVNLPAITRFTVEKIPEEITKWTSVFKELAGDPCYLVRKTVAGCIYEVAKILGPKCRIMLSDFVKLLRDESEEVLDALVPNISSTLSVFTTYGILSRETTTQFTLELSRALLKCQVEVFKWYSWRRMETFLQQLETLSNYIPPDFIHQHFTPLVLKLTLEARSRPVKSQAARTLIFFLRYCTKESHRRWIRDNVINLLCGSPSCYTRHIYILLCEHAIEIFSWKYFKEYFYLPLLTLGEDPISTVRLCCIKLFPLLKHMLILPMDKLLQTKLDGVILKLETGEKDKDVLATLRAKLKEMRAPFVNKNEALAEEKRKVEEEEKISQGKLSPIFQTAKTKGGIATKQDFKIDNQRPLTSPSSLSNLKEPVPSLNSMSFLHKHFYTDAGVVLPAQIDEDKEKTLEKNLSKLNISKTQSLDDLTTNMTDDVKVNLKKFNTEVKIRKNKRNSCLFASEQKPSAARNVKRYSLNMEGSKIPVSFRNKNCKKSKRIEDGSEEGINENYLVKDSSDLSENSKENQQINNTHHNIKKDKVTKASNLPVLRRLEVKKK